MKSWILIFLFTPTLALAFEEFSLVQGRDYYQILEVERDASAADVKAAYRKQIRANHPDHGGSETLAQRINAAYDVLKNEARRRHYDRWLQGKRPPSEATDSRFGPELFETILNLVVADMAAVVNEVPRDAGFAALTRRARAGLERTLATRAEELHINYYLNKIFYLADELFTGEPQEAPMRVALVSGIMQWLKERSRLETMGRLDAFTYLKGIREELVYAARMDTKNGEIARLILDVVDGKNPPQAPACAEHLSIDAAEETTGA
ncbi:MAG TPA: DnaJ domain-containing protein [Bdellovibrionales bacterium]|nr:DnaJ domain-containing protein [Bdellovibrionales bacterium]